MAGSEFPSIFAYQDEVSNAYNHLTLASTTQELMNAEKQLQSQLETQLALDAPDAISFSEPFMNSADPAHLILSRDLERIRSLLREKANTNLPIARLPVEILRAVFYNHADENECTIVHQMWRDTFSIARSWFILGQVCRLWRRVLFDMPSLWANKLFTLGVRKAPVLLPLAKEALLDINLCNRIGQSDGTWAYWEPYMKRAWRITNESYIVDQAIPFMNLLSSKPLPHLRAIKLSRHYLQDAMPIAVMADHPVLSSITMHNVYMCPPHLGVLSYLRIDLSRPDLRPRPSYGMLFEVLSRNRQLKHLELVDVLDEDAHADGPAEQLPLHALTSLTLNHGNYTLSIAILDGLQLPSLRTAKVQHDDVYPNAALALPLYRSLLNVWSRDIPAIGQSNILTSIRLRGMDEEVRREQDAIFRECLNEISVKMGVVFSVTNYKVGKGKDYFVYYTIQRDI
ncbi:hypothetical protein PENSPDRAFT_749193 [Peniophora sp. CONT]|nr:hypothetical protein PENSPDRAFT_749193 [Peniophora sp. CONT]